jgi:hypothetical protein
MLQNIIDILTDKKFTLGIGIGILIATIVITIWGGNPMSKLEIEMKARSYGMKYPSEIKVLD